MNEMKAEWIQALNELIPQEERICVRHNWGQVLYSASGKEAGRWVDGEMPTEFGEATYFAGYFGTRSIDYQISACGRFVLVWANLNRMSEAVAITSEFFSKMRSRLT